MASDIAVGIVALAAAKKDDRAKRAADARQRDEARHQRELALRKNHSIERRNKALEDLLEEIASVDRLKRLVAGLRNEKMSGTTTRVDEFVELAEQSWLRERPPFPPMASSNVSRKASCLATTITLLRHHEVVTRRRHEDESPIRSILDISFEGVGPKLGPQNFFIKKTVIIQ